jgi:hypothetical protein
MADSGVWLSCTLEVHALSFYIHTIKYKKKLKFWFKKVLALFLAFSAHAQ